MNHSRTRQTLRVAILDMNMNTPNRGFGYLKQIVGDHNLAFDTFDVRYKGEVPDTSYDIYVSSGGPGSPFDMDGVWDKKFFALLKDLTKYNLSAAANEKKYVFFVCHSYQLACIHFKVGEITNRKKKSFGTFTCHQTKLGKKDAIFEGLDDPFYIADFRDYQVIHPNWERMEDKGFELLALEKERPHVQLERAMMAIRFTPEMVGTQFHPEADAQGMLATFQEPERRQMVLDNYGEARYEQMIADLEDPKKIEQTFRCILPNFLNSAIDALTAEVEEPVLVA